LVACGAGSGAGCVVGAGSVVVGEFEVEEGEAVSGGAGRIAAGATGCPVGRVTSGSVGCVTGGRLAADAGPVAAALYVGVPGRVGRSEDGGETGVHGGLDVAGEATDGGEDRQGVRDEATGDAALLVVIL
jgi:hypothetical protein